MHCFWFARLPCKKLTKVLHAAVRFIFGLYGPLKRVRITPYLEQLHILPVKFHILKLLYLCIISSQACTFVFM